MRLAIALKRSMPKNPINAASLSLKWLGESGLWNKRGGRQSSNKKACLVSGSDGRILRIPRVTLATKSDARYSSGQPAWRHNVRTWVRYALTVDPLVMEGVRARCAAKNASASSCSESGPTAHGRWGMRSYRVVKRAHARWPVLYLVTVFCFQALL